MIKLINRLDVRVEASFDKDLLSLNIWHKSEKDDVSFVLQYGNIYRNNSLNTPQKGGFGLNLQVLPSVGIAETFSGFCTLFFEEKPLGVVFWKVNQRDVDFYFRDPQEFAETKEEGDVLLHSYKYDENPRYLEDIGLLDMLSGNIPFTYYLGKCRPRKRDVAKTAIKIEKPTPHLPTEEDDKTDEATHSMSDFANSLGKVIFGEFRFDFKSDGIVSCSLMANGSVQLQAATPHYPNFRWVFKNCIFLESYARPTGSVKPMISFIPRDADGFIGLQFGKSKDVKILYSWEYDKSVSRSSEDGTLHTGAVFVLEHNEAKGICYFDSQAKIWIEDFDPRHIEWLESMIEECENEIEEFGLDDPSDQVDLNKFKSALQIAKENK